MIEITYGIAQDSITLHQLVYLDTASPITRIPMPSDTLLATLVDLPQAEYWLN